MTHARTSVRRCGIRVTALAVTVGIAVLAGGRLGAGREDATRGFLITRSGLAVYDNGMATDCPDGVDPTVEENFQRGLAPAERERLLKPENAKEYAAIWKDAFITGPGDVNVCNNPKSFKDDPRHPPVKGVQGRIAFGMNLDGTADGRATAVTCGHKKFEGPNGETGIDNQLYRATGCSKGYRGNGGSIQQGGGIPAFLIEIRGVDNPQNDDRVEVGVYSTDDVPIQSQTGGALPNQTLHISPNPRFQNEMHGRIVNGEIVTDTLDAMRLKWRISTLGLFGDASENVFRRARLRLKLDPDGGLSGQLGGYRPLMNISTSGYCCKATASTANIDCAAHYNTLAVMADGDPDPETGACTTISAVHAVKGIPAFVLHGAVTRR